MSHPCVVTLDPRSAARVLFSGDRLVEVDLPAGTRVLYPRPPRPFVRDVDAAIRSAIVEPENSAPLSAKLSPGMRLTVVLSDLGSPFPHIRLPDARKRALEIVLRLAADRGIDDVHIVIATGLGRHLGAEEVRRLVGPRVFSRYWPSQLYNHDAVDSEALSVIGETEYGEVVELNRRVAESDLVVAIGVAASPLDGGHATLGLGLSSYRSMRAHQNPTVLGRCYSPMDPSASGLATCLARMGRLALEAVDVFAISATLNNDVFGERLHFLAKNEDDLPERERLVLQGLVHGSARLPRVARKGLSARLAADYGVTSVVAGETEAVHQKAQGPLLDQLLVPVQGQADVLVAGIPFAGPYNVGAFLNPLLVQHMAEGLLFNAYRGEPLVKKGGTLIITHPCTDKFDHAQHCSYIDFVHQILPETRNGLEIQRRYEEKFASNPAFLEMYQRGQSYHPAHPFFAWYWGEAARQHLGQVIVVGADNEYVPRLLGYQTAPNMAEALYRARDGQSKSLDILCLHTPPLTLGDTTPQ
jgi:hypothetical protein